MSDNYNSSNNNIKSSSYTGISQNHRNYRILLYYADVAADAVVLFLSYVISMYIRYNIMDSDPGLAVLSMPYLLIALVYSVVMACIIAFALGGKRSGQGGSAGKLYSKSNNSGIYKILSINVVGCLMLMSAFYIIGVVYFSRWALVLFWGISSVLIMVKKGIVQNWLSKESAKARLGTRVLVIGDGELAREYISSAYTFPFLGRNIVGYVRVHEDEKLKKYFEKYDWPPKGEEDSGKISGGDDEPEKGILSCLGSLVDFRNILSGTAMDEVVLALEDVPGYKAEGVMRAIEEYRAQKPVDVSMLTPYGNLVPSGSTFYEFGETKVIDLSRNRGKGRNVFGLGAILSAALLVILLILNLFQIGEFQQLETYEPYKCVIFAVFGIFLFSMLMSSFQGKPWANTKRAVITAVCCLAFAAVYEVLYSGGISAATGTGTEFMAFITDDFRAVGVSVLICWCVSGIIKLIEKDYPMMV